MCAAAHGSVKADAARRANRTGLQRPQPRLRSLERQNGVAAPRAANGRQRRNRETMETMMKRSGIALAFGLAASLVATAASAQATLNNVKQKGFLACGSNPALPGFGLPDAQGNWTGFDVDYCRAFAAAIFNDPAKVRFIPLSAKDRFTALQSGEVDVLVRNSTWTMSRDTQLGLDFPAVNYYDGQGFMVRKKLGVSSAKELDGATICTQQGTTTELNLADFFRAQNHQVRGRRLRDRGRDVQGLRQRPLRRLHDRRLGALRRAPAGLEPGRAHRPARDHLEGAVQPRRAPWRQPVGRSRPLGPLRPGQRRGVRRHQGQRRRR